MSNKLRKTTSKQRINTSKDLNYLYSKTSPCHKAIKFEETYFVLNNKKVTYDDFFFQQYGIVSNQKEQYLAYLIYVIPMAIMEESNNIQNITEINEDFVRNHGEKMNKGLSYVKTILNADLDELDEFDAVLRMTMDMLPTSQNQKRTELQMHLLTLYYADAKLFLRFLMNQVQFIEMFTTKYLDEHSSAHILRFNGRIYTNKELYAVLKAHEIIVKLGMELHRQLGMMPNKNSLEDYPLFTQLNETVSKCLSKGYFYDFTFGTLDEKKATHKAYCSCDIDSLENNLPAKSMENGIHYIYQNNLLLYMECRQTRPNTDDFTLCMHDVAHKLFKDNIDFKNVTTLFDSIKDMVNYPFFHEKKFFLMKDILDRDISLENARDELKEKERIISSERNNAVKEKEKMQSVIDSLNETILQLNEKIVNVEEANIAQIEKAHAKNEAEYKRNTDTLKERIKRLEQSISEKDKKMERDADIIKRLSIENKELNSRIFELFVEEDENEILMTEEKLEKIREKKILIIGGRYDMGARLLKNRNVSVTQIDDVSELGRVSTEYDLYVICTRFCAHITQEKADSMFLDKNKKMYFNGTNEELFLLELYDFITKKNI